MIFDVTTESRLKTLEGQRDALEAEIKRIEEEASHKKCEPLREELFSLRPQLEAIGAWPCAVIVDFHFGNTWLHANEAHLYFEEQLSCYRRSSSGGGGGSGQWTMPGVLDHIMRGEIEGDDWYWNNYFQSERSSLPNIKQMLAAFTPFKKTDCWIGQIQGEASVFFYEQVSCCPMCGFVDRRLRSSNVKIDKSGYGNDWQYPQKMRESRDILKTLLCSAKAILSGGLFANGLVFRRCEQCAKLSFSDNWRRIYKRAKDNFRRDDRKSSDQLCRNIESIWPDKFGVKAQVKTSIFRQAKKRARIKPLSRGELAFFSMHLAAAQVKELKATNRTHDTNKILNQAN